MRIKCEETTAELSSHELERGLETVSPAKSGKFKSIEIAFHTTY